jgi:fimbrial chaperone protein
MLWTALATLSPGHAANFTMDPWIMVLEPERNKISEVLTLKYIGGDGGLPGPGPKPSGSDVSPVPVELSVQAREVDVDGSVKIFPSKASEDFVIFPSQLILYPGDVQKVQLQWAGTTLPQKEISFSLIATQLPMDLGKEKERSKSAKAMLNVLTRYQGVLILRPAKTQPKVTVDSVAAKTDTTGSKLVLMLKNNGTGRQKLENMTVRIIPKDADGKLVLAKTRSYQPNMDLKAAKQSLFAGFKRKLELPWPEQVPVGPVQASVTFANAE